MVIELQSLKTKKSAGNFIS